MDNRGRTNRGWHDRGLVPSVRLFGLLLVLLAIVLVFGVVVADLLLAVSGAVGVLGALLATFLGVVAFCRR